MRALIVTVSDRCSRGDAIDESGPKIYEILESYCTNAGKPFAVQAALVPDEPERIQRVVMQATDRNDATFPTLVLLTGGTGFGIRDVTPEAIRPLLDKEAPGITQYMLHVGLQHTPFAWLSRAVAGVRKRSLIITFPGSPKAVAEVLPALLQNGLMHALSLVSGESDAHPSVSVPSTNRSPPKQLSDRFAPTIVDVTDSSVPARNAPLTHAELLMQQQQQQQQRHQSPSRLASQTSTTASTYSTSRDQPQLSTLNQLTPRRQASLQQLSTASEQSFSSSSAPRHQSPSGRAGSQGRAEHTVSIYARSLPGSSPRGGAAWRDRESKWPMVPMDEALEVIQSVALSTAAASRRETVSVFSAVGAVLAEPLVARFPHPPFPASVKDGYAVVASDGPGLFPVVGALVAGAQPDGFTLQSGQVCRVNTGGPVPPGSDAVIQVEDTKVIDVSPDGREESTVLIMARAKKGQDIRPIGCDVGTGDVVLEAGAVIHSAEVGLAVSIGATMLTVFQRPTVAVLSTGDELEDASVVSSHQPSQGKIFDSNRAMLMTAVVESGFQVRDAGIAQDNMPDTRAKLRAALETADVVICSGGVSMGEVDCVKAVLAELGADVHFGRVNMKPGKPATFASLGRKKLIFALPGNPVSAMVCYHLFVVPALKALGGMNPTPLVIKARLVHDVALDAQRPEYHRCVVSRAAPTSVIMSNNSEEDRIPEEFVVRSTGIQASHRLLSMTGANGMMILPSGQGAIARGTFVDVHVIGELQ